jgi:hypothetical protein
MPSPSSPSKSKNDSTFFYVVLMIITILMIMISAYIVMIVWNHVLIKKFPRSDIQELTYSEALAIMIACHILSSSSMIRCMY